VVFSSLSAGQKEMIIRSGFNVYPAEIEAGSIRIKDVVQSAVVGRKVEVSEAVAAFAQLIAGSRIVAADLAAYTAPQLTSYERPSEIILLSALPATSTGRS
jgi:long-chain acyl-CoA synthetase